MNLGTIGQFLALQDLLKKKGLSHWTAVLSVWLDRYTGLDRLVDHPDLQPIACVMELLNSYATDAIPQDDDFATDLSKLDFLTYRCRLDRAAIGLTATAPWEPLRESLIDYAFMPLQVIRKATETPAPEDTRSWLLNTLYTNNENSHTSHARG